MPSDKISNWINGQECPALSGEWFDKLDPSNGKLIYRVARSRAADVVQAVEVAKRAQPAWADIPPVQRGLLLHKIVVGMQNRQSEAPGSEG